MAQRSEDYSGGDWSEESPSKRLRTSHRFSNPAIETISSGEEKMELIRLKGRIKMLEAKVGNSERLLEEQYALSENERKQQELTKNSLESRIASLERQLGYVVDREKQALQRASEAEKLLYAERENAEMKLRTVMGEKRDTEGEYVEQQDHLRSENRSLHDLYIQERHQCTQLRYDCSQLSQEVAILKRVNAELNESVSAYSEELMNLRDNNEVLQDELKNFRDNYSLSVALEDDLKNLNAIRQENAILRKQMNRFKTISENPFLAKGKNAFDEVESLKEELRDQMSQVAALQLQLDQEKVDMETIIASKDDLLESVTARCSMLEARIANKDEVSGQFELSGDSSIMQDEHIGSMPLPVVVSGNHTESMNAISYMSLEEIKELLLEKDARIDYLESRYGLKLDYDPSSTQVIHLDDNPLSAARKDYSERMHALEEENQILRIRIRELEHLRHHPGEKVFDEPVDDDITTKVDLRVNAQRMETDMKDLSEKVQKLEEEKQKLKERMTEAHHKLTRDYREMVVLLFGYQLKMKEGGLYVVQSVYENDKKNYFLVQKGDGGDINLLQNEYTPRWMDFVDTYLMTDHSIPAFLSAVTLSLYEKDKEAGHESSFSGGFASTSTASFQ